MTLHRHLSCLKLIFALTFVNCVSPQIAKAETPVALSSYAQLLLDDRIIAGSTDLNRTVHQPTMCADNPVLTYEHAWEYSCVILWGSVLFDKEDQKFKMWYQTWGDVVPGRKSIYVCYAESRDGIHWTKPDLGIHEFEGSKKNNIVVVPQDMWLDSPTVVKDLNESDPGKRYKMSFYEGGPTHPPLTGIWHATSPDGIHFTRCNGPVVKAGDHSSMFWDPLRKKWVVITRAPGRPDRTIAFAEGTEFGEYSPDRKSTL